MGCVWIGAFLEYLLKFFVLVNADPAVFRQGRLAHRVSAAANDIRSNAVRVTGGVTGIGEGPAATGGAESW